MSPKTPGSEGKKTTLVWMAGAVFAVGFVGWRVFAGDAQAPADTDQAAATAKAAKAAGGASSSGAAGTQDNATPPTERRSGTLQVKPLQQRRDGPAPPKLPGTWFELPPRSGATAIHVLALHGRGDTARNFAGIARAFPGTVHWRFLQGPLAYGDGFQWFDSKEVRRSGEPPAQALELIGLHLESMPEETVVLGFSQGCMTILHGVAMGLPRAKAAACYGGWVVGQPQFGADARTPILFVGGTADTLATPKKMREAVQLFDNRGVPVEHIEHGGGHSVPNELAQKVADWLIRKTRGG